MIAQARMEKRVSDPALGARFWLTVGAGKRNIAGNVERAAEAPTAAARRSAVLFRVALSRIGGLESIEPMVDLAQVHIMTAWRTRFTTAVCTIQPF